MLKKRIVFISIAIFIILFLFLLIDFIPPDDMTRTCFLVTSRRIKEFVNDHNELPKDLYNLPKRKKANNSIKDGWGREIQYNILENGKVMLLSLGRDGKPGGEGKDSDIMGTFDPRIENDYPFGKNVDSRNFVNTQ